MISSGQLLVFIISLELQQYIYITAPRHPKLSKCQIPFTLARRQSYIGPHIGLQSVYPQQLITITVLSYFEGIKINFTGSQKIMELDVSCDQICEIYYLIFNGLC